MALARSLIGVRAAGAWTTRCLVTLGVLAGGSCLTPYNIGKDPPMDRLAFVTGLALDPRPEAASSGTCKVQDDCSAPAACVRGRCQAPSPYLFAINANSARDYNASWITAFDLSAFLDATQIPGVARPDAAPAEVAAAGTALDAQRPCRRDAVQPRIVECEETLFALPEAGVALGVFAGQPATMATPQGQGHFIVPVRGEPSLTVIDLLGGQDDPQSLRLGCGEGRRCAANHKLRWIRGSESAGPLPLHPRGVVASGSFTPPLAMAVHDSRSDLTLVGFEGPGGDTAMILHTEPLLGDGPVGAGTGLTGREGGADLSLYPCVPTQDGGTPPTATQNCTNPLVYATYRRRARIASLLVSRQSLDEGSPERCELAKQRGEPTFGCEVRARKLDEFGGGALDPTMGTGALSGRDVFGANAFSADGSSFFVLQRNPGALLRYDTRLDPLTQMPRNQFANAIDVCATATDLLVYPGARNYALVSCREQAQVFVLDLDAFVVLKTIQLGASPSGMVADPVRKLAYVPNFMDATVSVIDMSEDRSSRHSEIARLGLREVSQ